MAWRIEPTAVETNAPSPTSTPTFLLAHPGTLPLICCRTFGASAVSFTVAIVPLISLLFILTQKDGVGVGPVPFRPYLKEATL